MAVWSVEVRLLDSDGWWPIRYYVGVGVEENARGDFRRICPNLSHVVSRRVVAARLMSDGAVVGTFKVGAQSVDSNLVANEPDALSAPPAVDC